MSVAGAMNCFIHKNILRVSKANLDASIKFYTNILRMNYVKETWNDKLHHCFVYGVKPPYKQSMVALVEEENFQVSYENSGYWKIGITMYDVNAALKKMQEYGLKDDQPGEQFLDVGLLKHLVDPSGYTIELLQESFEANLVKIVESEEKKKLSVLDQPSEKPPHLGQITIRSSDIEKSKAFYTDVLGMKLVCIEDLTPKYPFVLYFFGYTEEKPPKDDLNDVANREWLYSRGFCQIEIQVYPNKDKSKKYITNDENELGLKLGHAGFSVKLDQSYIGNILNNGDDSVIVKNELKSTGEIVLRDPDGYIVTVIPNESQ